MAAARPRPARDGAPLPCSLQGRSSPPAPSSATSWSASRRSCGRRCPTATWPRSSSWPSPRSSSGSRRSGSAEDEGPEEGPRGAATRRPPRHATSRPRSGGPSTSATAAVAVSSTSRVDAAPRRDRLEFHHRRPFGHGGEHSLAEYLARCARPTTASWPRSTTAARRWNGTSRAPLRLVERRPQHRQNGQVLRAPRPLLRLDQRRQAEHSHRPAAGELHLHRLAQQLFVSSILVDRAEAVEIAVRGRQELVPRADEGATRPVAAAEDRGGRPPPARRERPAAAPRSPGCGGGPRRGRPWSRSAVEDAGRHADDDELDVVVGQEPEDLSEPGAGHSAHGSRARTPRTPRRSAAALPASAGASRGSARGRRRSRRCRGRPGCRPGGRLHDAEITPVFPRGFPGTDEEEEKRRQRSQRIGSDSLGAPRDRGASGGYRIFFPSSEHSSSTPSAAVPLRWSRMGFVSTNSAETTLPVSASISIARWASR